jgi:hypothetical protein
MLQALNDLIAAMNALSASFQKYVNLLEQWKSADWAKNMIKAQKDLESAIKTARKALNELRAQLIKFKKDNAGAMDDATVKHVQDVSAVVERAGAEIERIELILRDNAAIQEA